VGSTESNDSRKGHSAETWIEGVKKKPA
jgi:hypothetical protein